MIRRTDNDAHHLSAEISRRILYKLRDLNLSAERLRLADGRRVDFKGCLEADAPVNGDLCYRLTLDGEHDCHFTIALDRGRLHLALATPNARLSSRSRYLNLLQNEAGHIGAPQLVADLDPETAVGEQVADFLRALTLACLPAD